MGENEGGEPEIQVSIDEAERETVRRGKPALTREEGGWSPVEVRRTAAEGGFEQLRLDVG